jgi:hypothetical protein
MKLRNIFYGCILFAACVSNIYVLHMGIEKSNKLKIRSSKILQFPNDHTEFWENRSVYYSEVRTTQVHIHTEHSGNIHLLFPPKGKILLKYQIYFFV